AAPLLLALTLAAQEPPPIADNSFLIEEAYNQEPRVVQHINTLMRLHGAWSYSFTQEWPAGTQRHQLSYTVPLAAGLGDVAINYRYQLAGGEAVAFAPRVSVVLPTGDAARGRGTGGVGYQMNLPLSVAAGPRLVTHWNAGIALSPAIDETAYNAGASAIWRAHAMVNLMLELVWVGVNEGEELFLLNPGVRWAHNVRGAANLQIVPGISVPIDLGPGGSSGIFVYLSLEHGF
ncbi:MAG: transporter, partial [Gemmatimonadales bacterium]